MAFCEHCGQHLGEVAFCEGCGARVPAPPLQPQPHAASIPVAGATRWRWRPIAAVAALCGVAGAIVGDLLATDIIGGGDTRPAAATAKQAASGSPATGPARLPTADRADDTVAYLPVPRLLHSVTLQAGQDEATVGPLSWAVYAIPGTDAGSVCREIEIKWLPVLEQTMARDDARGEDLGSRYTQTAQGCAYSFTELHAPAVDSLGPLSYEIAVRAFAAKDPVTHNAAARAGSLGSITPQTAPLYEGPYVEVSRVLSRNPLDVEYLDDSVGAADHGLSTRAIANQIHDLIAYSGTGRRYSQAGDYAAAERNRRQTLRRAKRIAAQAPADSPLSDSADLLRDAAQASLDAVLAYQACGGVACASAENAQATAAKEAFVAEFNQYAHRYLDRSYVATDL